MTIMMPPSRVRGLHYTGVSMESAVIDRAACHAQVHAALAYYYDNQQAMHERMADSARGAEEIRLQWDSTSPLREQLQAQGRLP